MDSARFFRNPATGKLVVAQWPNLPLWAWLVATAASRLLPGPANVRSASSAVARVSLLVWALLEVTRGDSPFRRVLGAVVGGYTIASVTVALLR